MIFVTVGTHEQPFNRLIEYIDNLKKDKKIKDEIFIQTGYSTYEPQYCQWSNLISYYQMEQYVRDARIVVTHGGPASFIMPLQNKKIPIVVPRQEKFGEHVNNHQVEFIKNVAERMKIIIPVIDIDKLEKTIFNYELIINNMDNKIISNNKQFCDDFENLVNKLLD